MDKERRTDYDTRGAVQQMAVAIAKLTVLVETADKSRADDLVERRVMRHDINTILNAIQGIALLKDQLTSMQATMTRDIADGVAKATTGISELRAELSDKINGVSQQVIKNTTDIASLKDRNLREDGVVEGATKTAGWVWGLIGALASIVVGGASLYAAFGGISGAGEIISGE